MANVRPLMLEGAVQTPDDDRAEFQEFVREKDRLEDENRYLRAELEAVSADRERLLRTVMNLRTMLTPLHRALRAIFGEIELTVGEATAQPAPAAGRVADVMSTDPRWQSYKQQFPGVPAEIIDALLIQGEMKMTNLSKFIKKHYETTRKATYKLRDAGALTLTGGFVTLKK